MSTCRNVLVAVFLLCLTGCEDCQLTDARVEIPQASSPAACVAKNLGDAEKIQWAKAPVDQVVTVEGMPHPVFVGWERNNVKGGVSKIMGTERRLLVYQEFEGEGPASTTEMTGLLRRWSDLPADPWEIVKQKIRQEYGWQVPDDAFVLLEGKTPTGCP